LVREQPLKLPKPGNPIAIRVENLNWFANLSIYDCHWEIAGRKGVAKASVPASSKGTLEIDPPIELAGDESVLLEWRDKSGRLVDTYHLRFKSGALPSWELGKPAEIVEETDRYLHEAKVVYLRGKDCELAFEQTSGVLMWGLKANEQILQQGPHLHILKSDSPTTDDPAEWQFEEETHKPGHIVWKGHFGESFRGQYDIHMDKKGRVEIEYRFTYSGQDQYCREIGIEFDLPTSFDHLSWERMSSHSVYPEDHIGRPVGQAKAHPDVSQTVPPSDRPYGLDDHPWGCNDFRSCKRNVISASLTNAEGHGIELVSNGNQHLRATMGEFKASFKVLDYYGGSGGPGQWSVQGFHYGAGKLLKDRDVVEGKVCVILI
jgi:hypothetical protein